MKNFLHTHADSNLVHDQSFQCRRPSCRLRSDRSSNPKRSMTNISRSTNPLRITHRLRFVCDQRFMANHVLVHLLELIGQPELQQDHKYCLFDVGRTRWRMKFSTPSSLGRENAFANTSRPLYSFTLLKNESSQHASAGI